MNEVIYVVTTFSKISISENGFPDYGDIRSIGWFSDYTDAFDVVINNVNDIYENCYEYAVIERLPSGTYPPIDDDYSCCYFKYDQESDMYNIIDSDEVEIVDGICPVWSIG